MNMLVVIFGLIFSPGILATFVINANDFFEKSTGNLLGVDTFNLESYVKDFEYQFETHSVETEDGYILGIHRVPYGKNATGNETRPPVLIMHGLMGSSADFFIVGQNNSLALQLADIGYDVWLGNNRGNTWSRNHTLLNADIHRNYWDFSFHELGVYDDTAIIDYILNYTGYPNISYIGHSQGATQFFAMAASKPEYNDKINVMAGLAPISYMNYTKNNAFRFLSDHYQQIEELTNYFDFSGLFQHNSLFTLASKLICNNDNSNMTEICKTIYYFIFGHDTKQINMELLPNLFNVFPAGISVRELMHFAQEIQSGYFRQYDYGEQGNNETYNQTSPPEYNISQITARVGLFYGDGDELVASEDLEMLAGKLVNLTEKTRIDYEGFNHDDFIYAKDINTLVHLPLINFLNTYNGFENVTADTFSTPAPPPATTPATTPSTTPHTPIDSSGYNWPPSLLLVAFMLFYRL